MGTRYDLIHVVDHSVAINEMSNVFTLDICHEPTGVSYGTPQFASLELARLAGRALTASCLWADQEEAIRIFMSYVPWDIREIMMKEGN